MKRNEGFTLVELLVAMVVGSIVTLAATSVLLLGLRYNAISIGAAQRQNTTRIIMSLLEGVASEGTITEVESKLDSWVVYGKPEEGQDKGPVILQYIAADRSICTSDTDNPLLEGVVASHISVTDKGLLTLSVETEDGSYSSSVNCRNYAPKDAAGNKQPVQPDLPENVDKLEKNPENATDLKEKFIANLLSQYPTNGMGNPGVILDSDGYSTSWYYAQWYIGDQNTPGWDSSTPWCACYISWALDKSGIDSGVSGRPRWYANVDEFMLHFKNGTSWLEKTNVSSVEAGDLVFFDWEGGDNPEHVGVVLLVSEPVGDEPGFIYTIEGNSAGLVAMRMYSTGDPAIIGYGRINEIYEETLEDQILDKIDALRGAKGIKKFGDTDTDLDGDAALFAEMLSKGENLPESELSIVIDSKLPNNGAVVDSWVTNNKNHTSVTSGIWTRCGIGVKVGTEFVYIVVILDD